MDKPRIIWEPANQEYMPMGHPPSTDPAAFTDEELVEIEEVFSDSRSTIRRLIADLRASRSRVKELEDGIEAFLSGKNPL